MGDRMAMTHQPDMHLSDSFLLAAALDRGADEEDAADLALLLDALGPRLRHHFAAHMTGHVEQRGGNRGAVMRSLNSLLEDATMAAARKHGLAGEG
jgi:hypothetical protein